MRSQRDKKVLSCIPNSWFMWLICECSWVCVAKSVFKKPVRLMVTVMPTQTAGAGEHLETNIVFDGKTFTVTFGQLGGKMGVIGVLRGRGKSYSIRELFLSAFVTTSLHRPHTTVQAGMWKATSGNSESKLCESTCYWLSWLWMCVKWWHVSCSHIDNPCAWGRTPTPSRYQWHKHTSPRGLYRRMWEWWQHP